MANRLTQIATRTGDDGTTGLGDGSRVDKNHLRIQTMGDVDELNSQLGVLLAEPLPADVRELLVVIQHELFNLGGELSIPGFALLGGTRCCGSTRRWPRTTRRCRGWPSSSCRPEAAAPRWRMSRRTVARRAERSLVALGRTEPLRDEPRLYLNRLSDLLFVLARVLNRANLDGLGGDDVYWKSERLQRQGG